MLLFNFAVLSGGIVDILSLIFYYETHQYGTLSKSIVNMQVSFIGLIQLQIKVKFFE